MKDQDFEQRLLNMQLQHNGLVSREEEEAAWKKILLEIDMNEKQKSPKWWLIAASVAIVLLIGFLMMPKPDNVYVTDQTEQLDIRLADKSSVKLNRNSKLTVSNDFNRLERKVYLEGEAFFNVAKNTQKPFIISMNGWQVRVVGTSFNLKYEANTTTVSVEQAKLN